MEEDTRKNTQKECGNLSNSQCVFKRLYIKKESIPDSEIEVKDEPFDVWEKQEEDLKHDLASNTEEIDSPGEDEDGDYHNVSDLQDPTETNHEFMKEFISNDQHLKKFQNILRENTSLSEKNKEVANQMKLLTQNLEGGLSALQASEGLNSFYLVQLQQQQQQHLESLLQLNESCTSKEKVGALKNLFSPDFLTDPSLPSRLFGSFMVNWMKVIEQLLVESVKNSIPEAEAIPSLSVNANSLLRQTLINGHHLKSGASMLDSGDDIVKQIVHARDPKLNEDENGSLGSKNYLDDEELVRLSVPEFNRKIRCFPIPVQNHLKKRRRTLKNRAYANTCRARRRVYKKELEMVNAELKSKIRIFKKQLQNITRNDSSEEKAEEDRSKNGSDLGGGVEEKIKKNEGICNGQNQFGKILYKNSEATLECSPPFSCSNSFSSYSTPSSGRESSSPEPLVINCDKKKPDKSSTGSPYSSKETGGAHGGEECTLAYHIDDSELVVISTTELNKRIKLWPKEMQNNVKRRRRTLKNRNYAKNCRQRRIIHKEELEIVNAKLKKELDLYRSVLVKYSSRNYGFESLSPFALIDNKTSDGRGLGPYCNGEKSGENTEEKARSIKKEAFDIAEDSLDLELDLTDEHLANEEGTRCLHGIEERESLCHNNNKGKRENLDEQGPSSKKENFDLSQSQKKRDSFLRLKKIENWNRTSKGESLQKTVKLEDMNKNNEITDHEKTILGLVENDYSIQRSSSKSKAISGEPSPTAFKIDPSSKETGRFAFNRRDIEDLESPKDFLTEEYNGASNVKMKIDFFRNKTKLMNKKKNTSQDQVSL